MISRKNFLNSDTSGKYFFEFSSCWLFFSLLTLWTILLTKNNLIKLDSIIWWRTWKEVKSLTFPWIMKRTIVHYWKIINDTSNFLKITYQLILKKSQKNMWLGKFWNKNGSSLIVLTSLSWNYIFFFIFINNFICFFSREIQISFMITI